MVDLQDRLQAALSERYTVVRELGIGGMATVYLAEDIRHHRKVAVKVLRPDLALGLGADRFLREIEIAAQLQHPNILPLLDSGSAGGLLYYVMPYVEGESLRDRLARDGALPVREAVRILSEVADALSLAHRRGVVHRDIKPGNVLLSERHALVADFGVAKALSEATGQQALTTAGVALGTPTYMAPEQAAADPHIDHRADIYAVGVLAYELLTGRPPFTGPSSQAVLLAHMTQMPEPLSRDRPGIPLALDKAVMRCLAKHPAERWQSVEELLSALEMLATPSGGTAPTSRRPVVPVRRTVPLMVGVAAGVVLLAATGAVLLRRDHDSTPVALGHLRQVTNAPGLEIDPALSPDRKLISYAAGPLDETHIYVRQIAGGRPVDVTQGLTGFHRWPQWSPDGSQLLFVSAVGDTQYVDVAPALGGPVRHLVVRPKGAILGAAWSPDGQSIVYAPPAAIVVQRTNGNAPDTLSGADSPNSPSWSPDGSRIAYVESNGAFVSISAFGNIAPSAIHVVAVDGRAHVAVTTGEFQNASPAWSSDGRSLLFLSNRDGPRDLYRVHLARSGEPVGRPERITTGLNAHSIAISTDGKSLAYSVLILQANIWSIRLPARGSVSVAEAEPVTRGNQIVETANVSPDSRWLAFDSDQSGNADIYRLALTGGETEQLTTDPADNFAPAWSPDGSELAFHSFRNGTRDLFVMPAGGGAAHQVTSGPAQDRFPRWSPDGNRIAFQRDSTFTPRIYLVERDGQTGAWGTPRSLGQEGGPPVWSADGRGIFYLADGSIRELSVPGGSVRIVYQPNPLRDPALDGIRLTDRGRTIVFKAEDRHERASFWSLPVTGGTPRLLVRFDVPGRDSYRAEFDVSGDRVYFNMANRQSDIFMADLQ